MAVICHNTCHNRDNLSQYGKKLVDKAGIQVILEIRPLKFKLSLQINAYDLALNQNDQVRNLAQWMAREQLISFIGSDMHGTRPGARAPRMKEGIQWLYRNIDDEYAKEIVRVNAERYLNVEKLLD